MLDNYEDLDAVALAGLISQGKTTPGEVLESALHQAEKYNSEINAIVTPMYDAARAQVNRELTGPLAGVPFLVKDLNMVAGIRCSMGSRLWAEFVPDHDSEIVSRYRASGLVLMGKTNTPEVGLAATTESVFLGDCKNPWDSGRTPGGSSGGSAAAVAARIVPVAHATDGGGSIRIPASCCGLVGLKPTRARTPLGPDVGEGWGSMATGHVVSRTVRDSALFLDVTHGPASGDPYHAPMFDGSYLDHHEREPAALRIGIDLTPNSTGSIDAECTAGINATAALLTRLGHSVEPLEMPFDREELSIATHVLVASNVANTVQARLDALGINEPGSEHIETNTLNLWRLGRELSGLDYARAINVIHGVGRTVEGLFERYDLILSPTLLRPPVPLGFMNTNDGDQANYGERIQQFWGFTHLYNATGHPAISLPLHWSTDGLPVGMQFAASFGNELLLLQLARQLELAQPWIHRKPGLLD